MCSHSSGQVLGRHVLALEWAALWVVLHSLRLGHLTLPCWPTLLPLVFHPETCEPRIKKLEAEPAASCSVPLRAKGLVAILGDLNVLLDAAEVAWGQTGI